MTDEIKTSNRSEKQREASRRNGTRSTGPKTAAGKAIASGNRLKHNLLAQSVLFEEESRVHFNRSVKTLEAIFRPQDRYESSLVELMAVAAWRHTRLIEMERAAIRLQKLPDFADALEPAARAFLAYQSANKDRTIEYFNRQALRLDRQYHQALQSLNNYRRNPKTQVPDPNPQVR